jgi:hypothetical protein
MGGRKHRREGTGMKRTTKTRSKTAVTASQKNEGDQLCTVSEASPTRPLLRQQLLAAIGDIP